MLGLEIHEAASTGDYDTLEELVTSGKFDLNLGDEDCGNRTALHWACQKGYVECVRLLLENGARGTCRTDDRWTPAHFAAEAGKVTALRALNTAGVSCSKKDVHGTTPRRLAEIYNHTEAYKFLLQVEDLNEPDSSEESEDISALPGKSSRPTSSRPTSSRPNSRTASNTSRATNRRSSNHGK